MGDGWYPNFVVRWMSGGVQIDGRLDYESIRARGEKERGRSEDAGVSGGDSEGVGIFIGRR